MTSAGGTRIVGYMGALKTASPTSPSKSLTQGCDGTSMGPSPNFQSSILLMPFLAFREQITAHLKAGTAHSPTDPAMIPKAGRGEGLDLKF